MTAGSRKPKAGPRNTRRTLPVRHQPEQRNQSPVLSGPLSEDNDTTPNRTDYTRPETHQNLIHPDKEQNHRRTTEDADGTAINANAHASLENHTRHDLVTFPRDTVSTPDGRRQEKLLLITDNRPLTTASGDNRIRTGDPLLAKQVLYQLSYVPGSGQWSVVSGQEKGFFLITEH